MPGPPAAFLATWDQRSNGFISYVTDDMIYCIYNAPNEEALREHAMKRGLPTGKISKISAIFDPTTAEKESAMVEA